MKTIAVVNIFMNTTAPVLNVKGMMEKEKKISPSEDTSSVHRGLVGKIIVLGNSLIHVIWYLLSSALNI